MRTTCQSIARVCRLGTAAGNGGSSKLNRIEQIATFLIVLSNRLERGGIMTLPLPGQGGGGGVKGPPPYPAHGSAHHMSSVAIAVVQDCGELQTINK